MKRLGTRGLDRLVAGLLALFAVVWLLAVEGKQGIGRDEAQYMRAGERYWGWFEELGDNLVHGHPGRSFATADIDRYWSDNAPDHPVVMKVLYGLSWRAFHRCHCTGPTRWLHPIPVRGRHITLPLFARESTAFRFPAILMSALLVALVFWFARAWLPRAAAAAAAVLTLAQPHLFFHAQIACFDVPIAAMAFAVGFAYWKSLRDWRWGIATGALFGVSLGVKHNAWLMPFFLVVHYLWMRRGDWRARRLPRLPLAFVSMLVLGPLLFFAHWPWLWADPVGRARAYVRRHLEHEHYNFEYLGRNFNQPEMSTARKWLRATAPFVETGFTVPVTTLALAAIGGVVLARRRRGAPVQPDGESEEPVADRASWLRPGADVDRAPGAFVLLQTLGPLATLAVPSTPVFGGVKHFLAAMPYIALSAGVGLAALGRAFVAALPAADDPERNPERVPLTSRDDSAGRRPAPSTRQRLRRAAPLALAGLVCLPAVVETRRSHPDGLGHYNLLAGGFAGGASLGMNRQFWGYSVLPMLPDLDARAPENHGLYWHDVLPDAISMYKRDGRLSLAVGDTGFGEDGIRRSQLGILFYEKHWAKYEAWFWEIYGTTRPLFVREREGVPMVTLYERPEIARRAGAR
ncbi:MAG TPA: glycosyltransferase family 39 protein [Polyangia bacterium]|nr:glycosyltransferase family 39 protein [Polyangia bacterium]